MTEKKTRQIWDENGDYIQAHSIQWYAAESARLRAMEPFDLMPDETLNDVMWEIAEERERRDVISASELRRKIAERILAETERKTYYNMQKSLAIQTYGKVLRLIDELQGR